LIKRRYGIFLEHYGALLKLRELFSFHLIDASKSIDDVLRVILKEFDYQSSIELDQDTFDMIQTIPIASDIGLHARQNLVRRLENYQMFNGALFKKTICMIEKEFIPIISKHALSGASIVRS
jgi:adenylate kinase